MKQEWLNPGIKLKKVKKYFTLHWWSNNRSETGERPWEVPFHPAKPWWTA